jgi:hypothetical protein
VKSYREQCHDWTDEAVRAFDYALRDLVDDRLLPEDPEEFGENAALLTRETRLRELAAEYERAMLIKADT